MKEDIVLNKENNKEENKKKHNILKIFLVILLIFIILFYLYIKRIEPNIIMVREYAIIDNNLPSSFHGMKIVHFSDILYGSSINSSNIEKVVNKINELKPDIVIFTGDLFNSNININENDQNILKDALASIHSTYRKYAVVGDNDYIDKNSYIDIMQRANFIVLDNKNDLLYYGGNDPLMFIGTTSLLEKEVDINSANTIDINNVYKIWLNHEPTIIDELVKNNIRPNLIFSGHTLQGLVKLPFDTYLLKQDGTDNYMSDYYYQNEIKMYISNGLGTINYNVRFNNMPSMNLYRMYQY